MLTLSVELVGVGELPLPADPRWLDWLHPAELAFCTGLQHASDHLAARLAGKRAVLAALGLPDAGGPEPRWHDVEIRRTPGHGPVVVLHGDLARWHDDLELPQPGVSLTHAAGRAAAIAWLGPVSGWDSYSSPNHSRAPEAQS